MLKVHHRQDDTQLPEQNGIHLRLSVLLAGP
jgi:hypothetical protein